MTSQICDRGNEREPSIAGIMLYQLLEFTKDWYGRDMTISPVRQSRMCMGGRVEKYDGLSEFVRPLRRGRVRREMWMLGKSLPRLCSRGCPLGSRVASDASALSCLKHITLQLHDHDRSLGINSLITTSTKAFFTLTRNFEFRQSSLLPSSRLRCHCSQRTRS